MISSSILIKPSESGNPSVLSTTNPPSLNSSIAIVRYVSLTYPSVVDLFKYSSIFWIISSDPPWYYWDL